MYVIFKSFIETISIAIVCFMIWVVNLYLMSKSYIYMRIVSFSFRYFRARSFVYFFTYFFDAKTLTYTCLIPIQASYTDMVIHMESVEKVHKQFKLISDNLPIGIIISNVRPVERCAILMNEYIFFDTVTRLGDISLERGIGFILANISLVLFKYGIAKRIRSEMLCRIIKNRI